MMTEKEEKETEHSEIEDKPLNEINTTTVFQDILEGIVVSTPTGHKHSDFFSLCGYTQE